MYNDRLLPGEEMNSDPLSKKATQVAKLALDGRSYDAQYRGDDGKVRYLRDEIDTYRSDTQRRNFIVALRTAMRIYMEHHRATCKLPKPCGTDLRYDLLLVEVIFDELDALTPSSIRMDELSQPQQEAMERLKQEILDAMHKGHSLIIEANATVLEALTEGLEELWDQKSAKAKDWRDMVFSYFRRKITDKILDAAAVAPIVEEINKNLGMN